ncbi:hypothetical protein MTR67_040531 [Solanum verrucosum]|uniref:CNNM transmembrane domain-containing protein n=1 Tax=Solanum verrucosum TaxID=315347 RepID=A0AAF0ZPW0_SOLVR|nr:hypothetical protein MTR67_040531 [Solanum verrucosum]
MGLVMNVVAIALAAGHKTKRPFGVDDQDIEFGNPWWFVYAGVSCFLVLFAGIMSGLTLGLMSMGLVELEILQRSGTITEKKQAATILPVVQKQHQLLVTLLLCNAAAMEALPIYLDKIFHPVVAVVLSVTFVLAFGEIIPQAICSRYGLAVGANFVWLVRVLMIICYPISYPIGKVLDAVLGHHSALFRRAQLKALVSIHGIEAGKGGELTHDETTIIRGALDLATKKEASVAEVKDNQGWNLSFRRRLNDWEIDKLEDFYKSLEQASNLDAKEDSLQWLRANNGKFTIKSAYRHFDRPAEMLLPWPWKMIWKINVPHKVACFTWLVVREAVLTQDNLMKRGRQLCSRHVFTTSKNNGLSFLRFVQTAAVAMTPIESTFSLDVNSKLDWEAIGKILARGHSRVPVYSEHPKNIIGLLLVKSLLTVRAETETPVSAVSIRRMPRVPEDMPLYDILNEFQKGSSHMAAVEKVSKKDCNLVSDRAGVKGGENKFCNGDSQLTTPFLCKNDEKSNTLTINIDKVSLQNQEIKFPSLHQNGVTTNNSTYLAEDIEEGEVIGIITLEDVFEELLQEEIVDETDVYVDVHKRICVAAASSVARAPSARKLTGQKASGKGSKDGLKRSQLSNDCSR